MATKGPLLVEEAREALEIANGNQLPARVWQNGIAYVPEDRWAAIDTAPKDGAVFLGIGLDDAWPQPMRWEAYDAETAEELGEDGYWTYAEDLIADVAGAAIPHHWMPLPPPPHNEKG